MNRTRFDFTEIDLDFTEIDGIWKPPKNRLITLHALLDMYVCRMCF